MGRRKQPKKTQQKVQQSEGRPLRAIKLLEQRVGDTLKNLEDKLDKVVESANQHLGLLFKNEREIGSMVYTNSVRISVMRRIIREHLKVDDLAFDALVDQELAKRAAEQKELEAKQQEEAKQKALEEAAKESRDADVDELETREFGGDFGEEHAPDVDKEAADTADSGGNGNGGGTVESGGPVEEAGPEAGGVQQVAGREEERQPVDSV